MVEKNPCIVMVGKNPCKDIPNLDCQYKGCTKPMIGFESRFVYRYCEDHRNVRPVDWKHKDDYKIVMSVRDSDYDELMLELGGNDFEALGVKVVREDDDVFDLMIKGLNNGQQQA
jgi:hypothetical protein